MSVGIASFNFSKGTAGYLGKEGNVGLDNFWYALGGLGNMSDVVSGVDQLTQWEKKLRTSYEAKRIEQKNTYSNKFSDGKYIEGQHTGLAKSNHIGPDGSKIKGENNITAFVENPSLADISSGFHDVGWENAGMVGGVKAFLGSVKALKADWQLVGRSLYLGMKNLFNDPIKATVSLGMGAVSLILFTPKTLLGFYNATWR